MEGRLLRRTLRDIPFFCLVVGVFLLLVESGGVEDGFAADGRLGGVSTFFTGRGSASGWVGSGSLRGRLFPN